MNATRTVPAFVRRSWLPLTLAAALLLAALALVALAARPGDGGSQDLPAFTLPADSPISVRDVKQRSGDQLTLVASGGTESAFTVPPGTRVELLAPVEATDIRAGDAVSIVGIPNEVLSFSIHFVVVMADPASTVEGTARSAGGFAGHEAATDPADRPIVGGVVESIAEGGNLVQFRGPDGAAQLRLNEARPARIYRIESIDAADIREGDRVAADFSAATVTALLVMRTG